ncbi:dihydrolipoyl dehydrogenase [Estrella lausannensis]|uniref:Dihydrolipoyl dehydrogenase n=1 Tax=Estrella lausannensis TaxID=483423 RepID=A0A0H5DPI2_9BACT|nr:dihydrolipoyl dehydrogenase [Estrella lausannensis]CRX37379.1 Dihydrolipoamide dehydrogenase [Estrella lausannensis]
MTTPHQDDNPTRFDIAVIGGGPGGYPAAIKAAQAGKKVALIEAKDLGGTCLNRGCIPSKALISNASLWKKIQHATDFGIEIKGASFNYAKMKERKDGVVEKVRKSLEGLIQSNKIQLFRGFGKFISSNEIKITGQDNTVIQADKTIIATGSEPRNMPQFPFDYDRIHDSTSLLEITDLPSKIVIIGGGVIGCEFASLFNAFGVEVVIYEMLPRIIPMECPSVSHALTQTFKKKGILIHTEALVESVVNKGSHVELKVSQGETVKADIALVSVGRSLNTKGIGLEAAGVVVAQNGLIEVNEKMETTTPGIYAVGDIASKWWLAHVASHQGLVAAENACGKEAFMHYNAVPSVIFTDPEIGTVGMSLEQALESGYKATLGAFPFQALGKAQASLETEGFAQVVVDRETHQILGAQVVGHDASTLVAEMGIAIANEMTLECVTHTIHAHPTVAEVWLEAALMANETPLHLPPKQKSRLKPANV